MFRLHNRSGVLAFGLLSEDDYVEEGGGMAIVFVGLFGVWIALSRRFDLASPCRVALSAQDLPTEGTLIVLAGLFLVFFLTWADAF